MRGLLTKDMISLFKQKSFFGFVVAFIVLQLFASRDLSFLIGYLTFMVASSTIITINYDQADNGYLFLFSLPVNRTDYVKQKYLMSIVIVLISWILGNVLAVLFNVVKGTSNGNLDTFLFTSPILILVLLYIGIILPLQFKYGGNARLIYMGLVGVIVGLRFLVTKLLENNNGFVEDILRYLGSVSAYGIFAVIVLIIVLSLYISYRISAGIMKTKEF